MGARRMNKLNSAYQKMTKEQRRQIDLARAHGLNEKQVESLIGFDKFQMEQIRLGYENGLSMEKVAVYAKHRMFSSSKMVVIRTAFEFGLSIDEVKVLTQSDFTPMQMYVLFNHGYKAGLTKEQVKSCADKTLSDEEMKRRLNEYRLKKIQT